MPIRAFTFAWFAWLVAVYAILDIAWSLNVGPGFSLWLVLHSGLILAALEPYARKCR